MLLKFLRKNKRLFFITILLLVLVPFLFWGVGSIGEKSKKEEKGVSLRGKEISPAKLKEAQFDSQIFFLADFIEGNNIKSPEQFDMYKDWFNQLMGQINSTTFAVQEIILQEQVKTYGIKVSPEEVLDWITNFPLFQTRGQFDSDRYNAIVTNYFRSYPAQFEQALVRILSIKKLRKLITDTVLVSAKEAYLAYKEKNEKAIMYYIDFNTEAYLKNTGDIDETVLREYYEQHKEDFRRPERIKIAYLLFDPSLYKDKVTVEQKDIEDYYDAHKEEFAEEASAKKENEETSKIKPLEKVSEEIKKILVGQKAESLCQEEGLDFSMQLTEEKRIGDMVRISNEKGLKLYETDYLSREQVFIPELGQAQAALQSAWRMEIGTISDLLRVNNKWIILSPKDKKPSEIPEFTEVKAKINDILKNKKAEELANQAAEEYFNKIPKDKPFTMAIRPLGLRAKKTKQITKSNELFGTHIKIVKTQKGTSIVSPKKIYPISENNWEKEKETFTKSYAEQKKNKFFQQWLNSVAKS
jgi:peptidyl-prolyl cis-trans isomerase D